jgi:hypothetical protein
MKYLSVLLGDRDARHRERTVVKSFFFLFKCLSGTEAALILTSALVT